MPSPPATLTQSAPLRRGILEPHHDIPRLPPSALSDAQFSTLADLLRLRAGPAQDAARLVLVEGKSVSAAAIDAGLPYPRAWQAVQRAQRGLKLAHSVCGVCATIQPSGLARR